MMKFTKIGCIADSNNKGKKALKHLVENYKMVDLLHNPAEVVDVIVVLGGDGFMLHTLHREMNRNIPFFGINVGNIGFLLNQYSENDLLARIHSAKPTMIRPLQMVSSFANGEVKAGLAINEVSLMRASNQAAKIRILVNGAIRIEEMVCDGVMVATAAGSSAYNYSVGGSILPLESKVLSLTPISAFRPRRWGGALLPHKAIIQFDILEYQKRPVNAVADFTEFNAVTSVIIKESNLDITLLFDHDHSLEERIMREQFAY